MSTAIQDKIERQIVVKAPKERVYQAIADPEKMVKWFPEGVEGNFTPGERPTLDFGKWGKFTIYVVAANPNDYFAYRWTPGSYYVPQGFQGDPLTVPNTLVEFRLEDVPEGTRVNLIETGFATLPAEQREQSFKDNSGGWDEMIQRLANYLEGR